jgi:hypothetical protein
MTTSELTAPPEEAVASRSKTSGAGLLKWFWPEILGSVKGQLAETLDSGQSFGCRPMTLSGLKSVDQQIRPPLAAPVEAIAARRCFRFLGPSLNVASERVRGNLTRQS